MTLQSRSKYLAALFASAMITLGVITPVEAEYLSVHLGYVVPADRTAQPNAVSNMQAMMVSTQSWYRDQMNRWGFGPKTFRFETEVDGVTPAVHVVSTPTTAATIRGNIWGATIDAASDAGLSTWQTGQVWFLVPEAHEQLSDASVIGGTALGASFGSDDDPGVAMVGSDMLFRLHPDSMTDETPYAGQTIPEVGPYALAQDVSFPWFEGTTISSISSSAQGAAAHELGHAFGLPHNFINDANFNGNMMGNGLRGMRGAVAPEQFPQDDARLGYAAALALSTSRYFNADDTFTDNARPVVNIATSGTVNPVNGLLEIDFTAEDASELSAAILLRNGNVVGEMKLDGLSVDTTITTPYFDVDVQDNYDLKVYDAQGNQRNTTVQIMVPSGSNRAPQPFVQIDRSLVASGSFITFDAGASSDPDGSLNDVLVEWDIDGDGVFDTAPTTSKTLSVEMPTPGIGRVIARLTDALGAFAYSSPIAYEVLAAASDFDMDGDVDGDDFLVWQAGFGVNATGDADGDGDTDGDDFLVWQSEFGSGGAASRAAVPEPSAILVCLIGAVVAVGAMSRRPLRR